MTPEKNLPRVVPQCLRVLLVEDDRPIQLLIDTVLRRRGFAIEVAGDGQSALDRLRERSYDAILLDLMLPGVNGFEIVRDIKSRQPEMLAKTIVLTAASDVTLRDFDDGQLVRRVIRKPFDISELVEEVALCGGASRTPELLHATG